jgi:hypothetical protein
MFPYDMVSQTLARDPQAFYSEESLRVMKNYLKYSCIHVQCSEVRQSVRFNIGTFEKVAGPVKIVREYLP